MTMGPCGDNGQKRHSDKCMPVCVLVRHARDLFCVLSSFLFTSVPDLTCSHSHTSHAQLLWLCRANLTRLVFHTPCSELNTVFSSGTVQLCTLVCLYRLVQRYDSGRQCAVFPARTASRRGAGSKEGRKDLGWILGGSILIPTVQIGRALTHLTGCHVCHFRFS